MGSAPHSCAAAAASPSADFGRFWHARPPASSPPVAERDSAAPRARLGMSLLCAVPLLPRAAPGEFIPCDCPGQMERGCTPRAEPAAVRAQLLPSPGCPGGCGPAWVRPPSPGQGWKWEWKEAGVTRGPLMALSGCRVQSDPNGKLAEIPASCRCCGRHLRK